MATKAKKDNKNLIIGICAAVVVVIAIVVAVIFATKGSGPAVLNDAYFVSDGTKYVLTMDGGYSDSEDEEIAQAIKTHVVYTYSGDTITGATMYEEFKDEATAKSVYDFYKSNGEDMNGASVNGKYLVIVLDKSEYEDMTASDVKQQIEFMEQLQNMDFDDVTYDEDDIEIIEDEE